MKKQGIIIIAIVAVLAIWAISQYNGMVSKQEAATTALADLQATYQRRADMLPQLVKVVKAYAQHEQETFAKVTEARNQAMQIKLDADDLTPEKIQQFQKMQDELSSALTRLLAVAEAYPELKASENFKSLQIQIEGTENRINEARQKYNSSVQEYNTTIRRFPTVLVANMMGFDKMLKFEAAAGAEKAPDLDI